MIVIYKKKIKFLIDKILPFIQIYLDLLSFGVRFLTCCAQISCGIPNRENTKRICTLSRVHTLSMSRGKRNFYTGTKFAPTHVMATEGI